MVAAIVTACSPDARSAATPTATPPATGATPTTIDVATLDPCSLVDVAELSSFVAADMPAGQGLPEQDGYGACRYENAEASTVATVLVSRTPADAAEGEAAVEALPPGSGAEELHGVGGVAWFGYCPQCPVGDSTLTVIEAPLQFSISLSLPAEEGARRIILEELARSAIGRLGL